MTTTRSAAILFEKACQASRLHSKLAEAFLEEYGSHGPDISGCVRDHFPPEAKAILRHLAREVTRCSDAAYAARPPRVRMATMHRLASDIATRDGSGFYGPQPRECSNCGDLWPNHAPGCCRLGTTAGSLKG